MALLPHLLATQRALARVLADPLRHAPQARRLGLAEAAADALQAVRRCAGTGALTLDLVPHGPWPVLPRSLRSPLDGRPVPVRWRCLRGVPVAQTGMHAWNRSHPSLDGRLGAVLRLDAEPTRLLALTAGHVCGAAPDTRRGDLLRFESEGGAAFEGLLLDWQPNFAKLAGDAVRLDAGIAEIDAAALHPGLADRSLWPAGAAQALGDDLLRLRTRGREITGQGFEIVSVRLKVGSSERRYVLQGALAWQPSEPTEAGDSGAAIWNAGDELVAIHAGGSSSEAGAEAYAMPIGPVLRWAGASVVRRGEALRRPAPRGTARAAPVEAAAVAPAPSREADTLARTMYGEARGEGAAGMEAVAHVVLNRVEARSWWGRDVAEVCRKPWQFSCWNENDPNRARLLAVGAADASFRQAAEIAARLLAMGPAERRGHDRTQGATHYYAPARMRRPRWSLGHQPCARIGGHEFFRGIA